MSLEPPARAYADAVFAALSAKSTGYSEEDDFPARWAREGNVFMLRRPRLKAWEACLRYETELDARLPETDDFDEAIRSSSELGTLLGKAIGNPLVGGQPLTEDELRRDLLWSVARAAGGFTVTDESFASGYREWLDRHTAVEEELVTILPLHDMVLDAAPVHLEDWMSIDMLTNEEIAAALQMNVLQYPFGPSEIAFVSSRAGVRISWRVPRKPIDGFTQDERENAARKTDVEFIEVGTRVLDALRLFKSGRVAIEGIVTLLPHGVLKGGPLQTWTRRPGEAYRMTEFNASHFPSFWDSIDRVRRSSGPIDAAIRRFSYAGDRMRRDDEMLDLVASLEALLLAQESGQTELAYRFRLRGAVFIESDTLSRRQLQKQLRRAYNIRSVVAHGGTPKAQDLKSADDQEQTLDEFAEATEMLVRRGVRKAARIVATGGNWPPDWDGRILEQTD